MRDINIVFIYLFGVFSILYTGVHSQGVAEFSIQFDNDLKKCVFNAKDRIITGQRSTECFCRNNVKENYIRYIDTVFYYQSNKVDLVRNYYPDSIVVTKNFRINTDNQIQSTGVYYPLGGKLVYFGLALHNDSSPSLVQVRVLDSVGAKLSSRENDILFLTLKKGSGIGNNKLSFGELGSYSLKFKESGLLDYWIWNFGGEGTKNKFVRQIYFTDDQNIEIINYYYSDLETSQYLEFFKDKPQLKVKGNYISSNPLGLLRDGDTYLLDRIDTKNGKWSYWNKMGHLIKEEWYDNGKLTRLQEY